MFFSLEATDYDTMKNAKLNCTIVPQVDIRDFLNAIFPFDCKDILSEHDKWRYGELPVRL